MRAATCNLLISAREFSSSSVSPSEKSGRVGGNNGNEQRAVLDLAPDLLIPGVPTAQLTLIEKDLDAARTQRIANPLRRLRIL